MSTADLVEQQRAGAEVRHALIAAIRPLLEGEGCRKTDFAQFETEHARITVRHPSSFSTVNYRVVNVGVEPRGIRGKRSVTYRVECEKATPKVIAETARKAAERFKESNTIGRAQTEQRARERKRREDEDEQIGRVAAEQFADFEPHHYDRRKFKKGIVTLQATVRDGAVLFELRLSELLTPERAREVADVIEREP